MFRLIDRRGSARRNRRFGPALAAVAMVLSLPAVASADDLIPSEPRCYGLDCPTATNAARIPEALAPVPAFDGYAGVLAQREAGFYQIPAPISQGGVRRDIIVYLSLPGQLDQMPKSVRDLPPVRDNAALFETSPAIVVDNGLVHVPDTRAAAARNKSGKPRPKARAAHFDPWNGCIDGYFCIYLGAGFAPPWDYYHGPTYTGIGWQDLGGIFIDSVSSMVNHRPNADALMANGWGGNSFQYCAQQHSEDAELINNGFNDAANSIALLRLSVDRC